MHTRSVLEGELVLELGKLSVTYLTAHCEIFVIGFEKFKQSLTSRLGSISPGDNFTDPWQAGRSHLHKFINFRGVGHGVATLSYRI